MRRPLAALAPVYRPRRPTETVLYAVVRDHLETFLAHARETYEAPHIQRFGSSVNLNVHFHSMLLDGVFTRDQEGRLRFHPAPPPTREELDEVLRRVGRRALAWLGRRNLLDASTGEHASQEPRAQTSLDACAALAMQRGSVRALRDDPDAEHHGGVEAPSRDEGAVELDGFNLHAGVAIAGDDDLGRERLMGPTSSA